MFTKFFKLKCILPALCILIISSCQKDNLDTYNESSVDYYQLDLREELGDPDSTRRCFEWEYPVTLILAEGNEVEVNDKEEYLSVLKEWRDGHSNVFRHPKIKLPVNVILKNGETKTIERAIGLIKLLKRCAPCKPCRGQIIRSCFKPVFPIVVTFNDTMMVQYDTPEDLKQGIADWRAANPDSSGRPAFEFPYDVELQDGTVVTVYSDEDVKEIMKDCIKNRPHGPCIEMVFPVTLNYPDGTSEQIDDKEALHQAIEDWKATTTDSTSRPQVEFPYDVVLPNGEVITVTNAEEVKELIQKCRIARAHLPAILNNNCFRIAFPVALQIPGGSKVRVDNIEEYLKVMKKWIVEHPFSRKQPHIVFPISVIFKDSGDKVPVRSANGLRIVFESCKK